MPRAFLIDTDVASDDAVALIMALRAPDVRVVAITTVAGNVEVQQATRNALYTVELCAANVPVYTGADKPLLRAHQSATWFHGRDGLGDHNYPPPHQSPGQSRPGAGRKLFFWHSDRPAKTFSRPGIAGTRKTLLQP